MSDWSAIHQATENLRLCTARMKLRRLGLPMPGALVRVQNLAILAVIDPDRTFPLTVQHRRGDLLLLVYVNAQPAPHPKGPLTDPVELVFMGRGGALYTTGTRAAGDVMNGFEVL